MDRKAIGTCAALAASLSVWIAGCGTESAGTAPSARKEPPASPSRGEAVVVSVRDEDASSASVATSATVDSSDPYSDNADSLPSVADAATDPYADGLPVADTTSEVAIEEMTEVSPAVEGQPTEALPPAGADELSRSSAESEVKFAVRGSHPLAGEMPAEQSQQTIRLEVQADQGEPQAVESQAAAPQVHESPIAEPPAAGPQVVEAAPVQPETLESPPAVAETAPVEAEPAAPVASVAKTATEPAEEAPREEAAPARPLVPLVITPRKAPPGSEPPVVEASPEAPIAGAAPEAAPQPAAPQEAAPQVVAAPEDRRPLPQMAPPRSPAMVAALARADQRVRHAIQLAEKGALYASRKEFIAAVNEIAQARDVEQRTRQHTNAAIAGFRALKEAHQLAGAGLADINVKALVASHRTPVLKDIDVADMPPSIAAQYYFDYAKDQLALCVGRDTVGSIALYGLGKIILAGAGRNSSQLQYSGPATALFQAAVIAEPQNYRAAHELGVLLAGTGQLELARQMLMGSAAASTQPMIWQNLSVVHSRLGEAELAARARQNAETLAAANPTPKGPPVQWVDPATFASTSAPNEAAFPPAAQAAPGPAKTPPAQPEQARAGDTRHRDTTKWNPLNLRR